MREQFKPISMLAWLALTASLWSVAVVAQGQPDGVPMPAPRGPYISSLPWLAPQPGELYVAPQGQPQAEAVHNDGQTPLEQVGVEPSVRQEGWQW